MFQINFRPARQSNSMNAPGFVRGKKITSPIESSGFTDLELNSALLNRPHSVGAPTFSF
jgi:hypothetical protein